MRKKEYYCARLVLYVQKAEETVIYTIVLM